MKHIFLLLVIALVGCQKTDPQVSTNDKPVADKVSIDEAIKSKAIAAKEDLFKQLSGRLMEVMKSEGPAAAIEVCSKEASQFAKSVSEQHNLKIGRTALKLRNSMNAPPTWATELTTEDAVEPQFVSINEQTAGALLPIKLQQKCLACHGSKESLAPAVKEQLAKHYPNDEATGFHEGDLRGWFWVEVPQS